MIEQSPQKCSKFDLKTYDLPPLYMQNTWSKSFLGTKFLFGMQFENFCLTFYDFWNAKG